MENRTMIGNMYTLNEHSGGNDKITPAIERFFSDLVS
jgi:hypothetical protein